jgi:hypothetical protein
MWPLAVVMVDVDVEYVLEVPAVENQQPVETFRADGAHEAFGDRVCLCCPHRRLHRPDALTAEDVVEEAAVLAVAVADQETDAPV